MFEVLKSISPVLSAVVLLLVVVDNIKTSRKINELEERIEDLENK